MTTAGPVPGTDALRHASLESSGLPARILAVLRGGGAATLGDLCRPPAGAETLDADDRALLGRVAGYACAACAGRPPPLNLPEWLALFLPPRLADAVQIHFGLREPTPALQEAPLRDTGFKLNVSRERARQLIELACGFLRQALPLRAAEPLYRAAERSLHEAGGVLDGPGLARLRDRPEWGGAAPGGACLLLARLTPGRLTLYRGFFSAFSAPLVERAEKALRDRLNAARGLLPLAEIAAGLPRSARPPGVPSAEPLLFALLRHLPDVLVTRDGRAGRADRDGGELLREILAAGEAPLRGLVDSFNERLYPECRRGSGYVRDTLQHDPQVRKPVPGRYVLPGGLQAGLPL